LEGMSSYYQKCSCCKTSIYILARREDIVEWHLGALIQEVLHYLTIDERELLISGVCATCFDGMFNEHIAIELTDEPCPECNVIGAHMSWCSNHPANIEACSARTMKYSFNPFQTH